MTVERREHIVVDSTPAGTVARREKVVADTKAGTRTFWARVAAFVWLMFGILIALIAIRVGLRLIDANATAGFAAFIYSLTDVFLAPFNGLVAPVRVSIGNYLEISSIIAMFVYALIAWIIVQLLRILFAPSRNHSSRSVTTIERD
jgi:hypothetical protein